MGQTGPHPLALFRIGDELIEPPVPRPIPKLPPLADLACCVAGLLKDFGNPELVPGHHVAAALIVQPARPKEVEMPAIFHVDQARTFKMVMFLSSAPKTVFGNNVADPDSSTWAQHAEDLAQDLGLVG